jgi:hypothetical protein
VAVEARSDGDPVSGQEIRVANQAELDDALEAGNYPVITSDAAFDLPSRDDICVYVEGSSQPRIDTRDSSQPRIVTWDSSQPRIDTWGSSQPRIDTWGSSQPRIVTWGSSQPRIVTWGSSQLQARSTRPITITTHGPRTVVTRNKNITVEGDGIVIDADDPIEDATTWCAYYGVDVAEDGTAVLFKRVNDDWCPDGGYARFSYEPGREVVAPDFDPTPRCGGGLHLSPHPLLTERYSSARRIVAVRVVAADIIPIPSHDSDAPDKCKVPKCVSLYECDEDGEPVETTEQVAS